MGCGASQAAEAVPATKARANGTEKVAPSAGRQRSRPRAVPEDHFDVVVPPQPFVAADVSMIPQVQQDPPLPPLAAEDVSGSPRGGLEASDEPVSADWRRGSAGYRASSVNPMPDGPGRQRSCSADLTFTVQWHSDDGTCSPAPGGRGSIGKTSLSSANRGCLTPLGGAPAEGDEESRRTSVKTTTHDDGVESCGSVDDLGGLRRFEVAYHAMVDDEEDPLALPVEPAARPRDTFTFELWEGDLDPLARPVTGDVGEAWDRRTAQPSVRFNVNSR